MVACGLAEDWHLAVIDETGMKVVRKKVRVEYSQGKEWKTSGGSPWVPTATG